MCEGLLTTLECELLQRRSLCTKAEARSAILTFVEGWYSPARRESALGCKSPAKYERTNPGGLQTLSH